MGNFEKFITPGNGRTSEKSGLVTLLLCIFLGWLGIHRFYLGKTLTGIIMLLTGGCFGILVIIDIILIATGNMKDGNGSTVKLQIN